MKMKKTFKFLTLTVLLSMVGAVNTLAANLIKSTQWDDTNTVRYKILSIDRATKTGTVSVIGSNIPVATTTELSIPETVTFSVNGEVNNVHYEAPTVFSVTEIEKNAFATLSFLETLNIPASVEKIDEGAFNNAVVLETVNFAAGSQLKSVGNYVFGNTNISTLDLSNCSKLSLCEGTPFLNAGGQENHQLVTVILPKEIDCIGNAFTDITNLKTLDLGGTKVYTLDPDALDGTSIEEVVLGRPTEMTVATVKIDCNALPKTIKKLVINGDIATAGAICAQPNLTQLTEVQFNGDLDVEGAVPENVFPNSPLQKLSFNNIKKAGAIAPEAFKDKKNLSAIDFNGDIVAGGIGANAFESAGANLTNGSCATVNFKGELKGAAAIGYQAFWKAGIDVLTFKKDIAAGAIADEAFYQMTKCGTDITFEGELLGANAIGNKSFAESWVTTLTFAEPIAAEAIEDYAFQKIYGWAPVTFARLRGANAIGENAFELAQIGKTTFEDIAAFGIAKNAFLKANFSNGNADVEFNGRFDGTQAIGPNAFQEAVMAHLLFAKDIQPNNAIGDMAFYKSRILKGVDFNGKLIGDKAISDAAFQAAEIRDHITFKGDIEGESAIGESAFEYFYNNGNSKGTPVLFEGSIVGKNGIGESAFASSVVSTLTINGSLKGAEAISEKAFENNTKMTEFTLKGEVANDMAIAAEAFAGNKNLVKVDLQGNIYAPNTQAIAPTAFQAIGTATANGTTVNFGAIKSSQAVAAGAFAGAKLYEVNYNELMAEKAIADNQFAAAGNYAAAEIKTVNFQKELKAYENTDPENANLVGTNAFTGTKVAAVNFKKDITVKHAILVPGYSATSFKTAAAALSPFADNGADLTVTFDGGVVKYGIGAYAFANSQVKKIVLNNKAEYEELAFRNFSFYSINAPEFGTIQNQKVDIFYEAPEAALARSFAQKAFYKTDEYVDILFHTTKDVQDHYTQVYNPSDMTPYRLKFICTKVIDLVQAPDGYYYGAFDPQNEQYIIEKYQDNGPVNVYSAYYDDKTLEATGATFKDGKHKKYAADLYINPLRVQDKGKYVLNAGHTLLIKASGNKVIATQDIYNRDGSVQTFAGLSPWACNDLRWNPAQIYAIEKNGVLLNRPYPGYVGTPAIDNGDVDWYGNTIRDYQVFRQYNFATKGVGFGSSITIPEEQMYLLVTNNRDNREKYSSYDHNEEWFDYNGIPWEESVAEKLADAYEQGWDDSEADILAKINEELDEKQDNIDDAIEQLIIESFGEGVLEVTEDNKEKVATLIQLADELAPIVADYYKAKCDLRVAQMAYDAANPISCVDEDSEWAGKNFSDVEDGLLAIINQEPETVEVPDDLYKQYINGQADNSNKEELENKAAEDKALADAYAAAKEANDAMQENEHAAAVWSALTFDKADYTFTSYADEDASEEYATGSVKVAGDAITVTETVDVEKEIEVQYTPVVVRSNNDATGSEIEGYVGNIYYIKALNGETDAEEYYELYNYTGIADQPTEESELEATGIYVKVEEGDEDGEYSFTSYTKNGYTEQANGTVQPLAPVTVVDGDVATTFTPVKVLTNSVEGFEGNVYYIEALAGDIDEAEYYQLFTYNGTAAQPTELTELEETDLFVKVTQDETSGDWSFTSYTENDDPYTQWAEGTVEYSAPVTVASTEAGTEDVEHTYTPVEVLSNTVDGFVGNTYYVEATEEEFDSEADQPLQLFTKDEEEDAFTATGIYVNIEEAEGVWVENYSSVEPNTLNCLIESEKTLLEANIEAQKALAALVDANPKEAYDADAAEAAAAAAEASAEAAEDWAWLWYTEQVRAENFEEGAEEIHNWEIAKRNHELEKDQKAAQAKLDELQALDCYAAYAEAKEALGVPSEDAVEDDPETEDIDESKPAVEATGAYAVLEEKEAAKDDKVQEVKDALNAIETGEDTAEENPARLNIIWTDGSDQNTVGIMEAVVNGTANRAGDGAIYNLNGMRVKNAAKGIYIQNGKKIIK